MPRAGPNSYGWCPMPTIPPRWGFTRKNLSDACSSFSGLTGAVPSRAQANKKTDKADTRNPSGAARRSEEHTSELQSHHDLVCRLLLEKKKITKQHRIASRTRQGI